MAVLSGAKKRELGARLEAAFHAGEQSQMEYIYYPVEWKEPYRSRRVECGKALYRALGIRRADTARRKSQWAANYRAFDAPVLLLFLMDKIVETGSYLDCGMFIQSVMLAAMEHGLATCPQAALAEYPQLVKPFIGCGDSHVLVCGMALGYEDPAHPVNNYRTVREPVESFARFCG